VTVVNKAPSPARGRHPFGDSWTSRRPRPLSPDQRITLRMLYKRLYPDTSDKVADRQVDRWLVAEYGVSAEMAGYATGLDAIAALRAIVEQTKQQGDV
jgi:hypothetical protein